MAVIDVQMRDSGIDWIGEIPAHWNTRTLYQLVSQVRNKNKALEENNLLSLSYGKIKRKDINSVDGLLPASFEGYNIIEDGDIVLRLTDLQNDHTSLRVGLATERGIITSAYITLRPADTGCSKFLYYLLHSFDIKKGFYGMGSGVRQGLNFDEVKELRVAFPPQEDQSAIAAYLDDQCAQIDNIIVETKASIEEYKKWKAAVIFEAVTKGLDPDVQMKNSGRARWGDMPYDWGIAKIKHIAKLEPICIREGLNQDTVVSYAPMECIRTDNRIPKTALFSQDGSSYSSFNDGDIALAKVTPCFQNRNACIMESLENGYAFGSSELFNLRPIGIDSRFLLYWLQTEDFIEGGVAHMTGVAGLKRVPASYVRNAVITYPSPDAQNHIVKHLDTLFSDVDKLLNEKQSLISDLEAYKKSLIYETVTGKRKVV